MQLRSKFGGQLGAIDAIGGAIQANNEDGDQRYTNARISLIGQARK